MKEILISHILNNMNNKSNYADDIWKRCLDKKGKRYKRKDINNSLRKLEVLGFIKKIKISSTDTYYNKLQYTNPEDYLGFVNNLIFENESKIKESLKKLENKKIFVDITKDLNSYKLGNNTKKEFDKLLESISNMTEIISSIKLVMKTNIDEKLKNQLDIFCNEINETLEQINQKIIVGRKSNEMVLIQRVFTGRIPNNGYLKL
ncbi:MAG: hypothetical protein MAG458_01668 [Nitrosopumilus sp.]|nr:hypothetical protein [Nitrosopumilus sp.]